MCVCDQERDKERSARVRIKWIERERERERRKSKKDRENDKPIQIAKLLRKHLLVWASSLPRLEPASKKSCNERKSNLSRSHFRFFSSAEGSFDEFTFAIKIRSCLFSIQPQIMCPFRCRQEFFTSESPLKSALSLIICRQSI